MLTSRRAEPFGVAAGTEASSCLTSARARHSGPLSRTAVDLKRPAVSRSRAFLRRGRCDGTVAPPAELRDPMHDRGVFRVRENLRERFEACRHLLDYLSRRHRLELGSSFGFVPVELPALVSACRFGGIRRTTLHRPFFTSKQFHRWPLDREEDDDDARRAPRTPGHAQLPDQHVTSAAGQNRLTQGAERSLPVRSDDDVSTVVAEHTRHLSDVSRFCGIVISMFYIAHMADSTVGLTLAPISK